MKKRIVEDFKQNDQVCVEHGAYSVSFGELDKRLKTVIKVGLESIKISNITAIHASGTPGYVNAGNKHQARKKSEDEYNRTRLVESRSSYIVRMIDRKNGSKNVSTARIVMRDMDEDRRGYVIGMFPGEMMPAPSGRSTVTIPLSKLNSLIGNVEDPEHAREAIKKLAKIISELTLDSLTEAEMTELLSKEF